MKRIVGLGIVFAAASTMSLQAQADHEDKRGDRRLAKAMAHLDEDENGVITRSEFKMPEGRDSPEMRLDLDGDGSVTREEAGEVMSQRSEEALLKFDNADSDGNGVLTVEERRETLFNRIDADGDGELTKSELRDSRKQMGKRSGRHGGESRGMRHQKRDDRRGYRERSDPR